MRENSKLRPERFDLSLSLKQVLGVLAVALLALGGAFLLGASVSHSADRSAQREGGRDPLARLDEPLLPAASHPEPAPELQAHQALTGHEPLDESMPLQAQAAPGPSGRQAGGSDDLMPPQVAAAFPAPSAGSAPAQVPSPPSVSVEPVAPAPPAAAAKPVARPSRPARRPAAAAAAHAVAGHYTIQVGSVPQRAAAERLARRLAARKPRIVAADVPGRGRWYRVQVGAFETRELARRQLSALGRSGIQGVVVAAR